MFLRLGAAGATMWEAVFADVGVGLIGYFKRRQDSKDAVLAICLYFRKVPLKADIPFKSSKTGWIFAQSG